MTPEQIQELLDKLFAIAGSAASQGWELAIRQVYADAAVFTMWVVVGLALILLGFLLRKEANRKWVEDDSGYNRPYHYDSDTRGYLWGGAVTAYGFGAVAVVINLGFIIPRLINPGWYAVQMLMGLVK